MQSHRTPFQPNLAAIQAARWFVGAWKAVSPLGSPGIDQQYGGSARLRLGATRPDIDWSQVNSISKLLAVEEGHPLPS